MSKDTNKEIYKYYYEYWKNANWKTDSLYNLSTPDLDITTIRKGAINYATNHLNITKEQFYKQLTISRKRLECFRDIHYSLHNLFEQLSDTNDKDEIIAIFQNSTNDLTEIEKELKNYVKNYRKYEIDQLTKSLEQKLNFYKQYLKDSNINNKTMDKKTIKQLNNANEIIAKFTADITISKEEFCKKNNITNDEFQQLIQIIKENNSPIYNKFIEKTEKQKLIDKKNFIKNIPFIINNLKEKNFSILDYHLLTNTTIIEALNISRKILEEEKITYEDFKILEIFLASNKNINLCNKKDIEYLLNEKLIINPKLTDNDTYTENTGHEITKEEKEEIIEDLKLKNIPITKTIYYLAVHKLFQTKEQTQKRK